MKKILNNKLLIKNDRIDFPIYLNKNLNEKWIHIGLGNFHRSHQAFYLHKLLQKKLTNWSIIGLEIIQNNSKLVHQLNKQDCLYTLITKDISNENNNNNHYIIGSITSSYCFSIKNLEIINNKIKNNDVEIITATITENGYYEKNNKLDLNSLEIISDLKKNTCLTIYGFLHKIIYKRYQTNKKSFTIMSCDNIANNGEKLSKYFFEFCQLRKSPLVNWVEDNINFPNSMVDRITPKYNFDNTQYLENSFDYVDNCVVESEEFIQWIIEDKIQNNFPDLTKVGVDIVKNVEPYQEMKMKMLNASHCSTSFLGFLNNFVYVHETFNNNLFCKFIEKYLDFDVIPFLKRNFYNYENFKKIIIKRFANKGVKDTIIRTTINGSKNLEIFVKPSFQKCYENKISTIRFALIYSSWLVFLEENFLKDSFKELEDDNIIFLKEIMSKHNYIEFYLNNSNFPGINKLIDNNFTDNFYCMYNLLKEKKISDAIELSIK